MYVLTVILSLVLAAALAFSAFAKFSHNDQIIATMRKVGVSERLTTILATLEVLGAIGLLVGLGWEALGILTAALVVVYFVGALLAHLRVGDRTLLPAGVLLLVSVLDLVFRSISA